jgi:hypothetical protein
MAEHLDVADRMQGENLQRLVKEVHREFAEKRTRRVGDGCVQVVSVRVAAVEAYSRLPTDVQVAVMVDVMRNAHDRVLSRRAADIFSRADTLDAYFTDLICEVVSQELMNDPIVMMENESREVLPDLMESESYEFVGD